MWSNEVMKNLAELFRLIETTRAQSQYGYIVSEIPKSELSDLAQHHYLVTFIAWQLALLCQESGGQLELDKVLELALLHDLGELLGGDIAMPYAKANPKARELAKAFEAENQRYLAKYFPNPKATDQLFEETIKFNSDEAVVAKVADYLEITHYKLYIRRLTEGDITMVEKKIADQLGKVKNKKTKVALQRTIRDWLKDLSQGQSEELFEAAKKQ